MTYIVFEKFSGPIVLTDAQFKGTTNISYRYGLFVATEEKIISIAMEKSI